MESRLRSLLLKLGGTYTKLGMLFGLALPLLAFGQDSQTSNEPIFQPQIERPDFEEAKIHSKDFEISVYVGMMSVEDFGVNTVFGGRIGYHVTEKAFFEGTYGQTDTQKTSYEKLSGSVQLLPDGDRALQYYNISVGYDVFPGESFLGNKWAFNTALYAIGGIGSTHFAGDDMYTINYGVGYRFVVNNWAILRIDVRDHFFNSDVLGEEKTTHNLEFITGMSVFF